MFWSHKTHELSNLGRFWVTLNSSIVLWFSFTSKTDFLTTWYLKKITNNIFTNLIFINSLKNDFLNNLFYVKKSEKGALNDIYRPWLPPCLCTCTCQTSMVETLRMFRSAPTSCLCVNTETGRRIKAQAALIRQHFPLSHNSVKTFSLFNAATFS